MLMLIGNVKSHATSDRQMGRTNKQCLKAWKETIPRPFMWTSPTLHEHGLIVIKCGEQIRRGLINTRSNSKKTRNCVNP